MSGPEKLRQWLGDQNMTYGEFAERVGTTRTSVNRWIIRYHRPAWSMLARIHKETGGAVAPNDWLGEAMKRAQAGA